MSEVEALRAEVERLREGGEAWARDARRHFERAERLEEGIRALADRWDKPLAGARQRYNGSDEFHDIVEEEAHRRKHAKELRALLSPSPAATTGEAGHNLLASDCRKRTEGWIAGNSCSVCAPAPVSSGEAGTGEALARQALSDWEARGQRLCMHTQTHATCGTCGIAHRAARPAPVATPSDEGTPNIGDTCCGKCPGDTCYVDQISGA